MKQRDREKGLGINGFLVAREMLVRFPSYFSFFSCDVISNLWTRIERKGMREEDQNENRDLVSLTV